jgi:ATP-dependent helicase/nuclease subunit B
VPAHDEVSAHALERAGGAVVPQPEDGTGDLASLRRHLFDDTPPPTRELDGTLAVFSAPGEGRESIEIARRILTEARRGVRFDEMAILIRTPHHYHGLLEHALDRAGIPAWFDRGTRRPRPAGRVPVARPTAASNGRHRDNVGFVGGRSLRPHGRTTR